MLGIVIDENQPEYGRGDFLVRPIIGADPESGSDRDRRAGAGRPDGAHARSRRRVGRRGPARRAARPGRGARHAPAAGVLLFTCNGRGSHMFEVPDHDASAIEDALGAPAGGFFCAGEIGPVGGRNFLHGFTATMARLPAPSSGRFDCASSSARALAEDLGTGDVTAEATVPAGGPRHRPRSFRSSRAWSSASTVAAEVFRQVGADRARAARRRRGSGATRSRSTSPRSSGPARALLAGERTALNFLVPPVRHRDPDRPVRPTPSRAPGRRSSTRARPPRGCGRSRRRRSRRAAGATTAWASTTRS